MSYTDAPKSVRSLEQRIRNLEGSEELAIRQTRRQGTRRSRAETPLGSNQGRQRDSAALWPRLSVHPGSRLFPRAAAGRLRSDFEDSLAASWAGFTGRLIEKAAPRPTGVPTAYVMQPFDVRVNYCGWPWCTVKFELGHNEIGDADEPEYQLADGLAQLFTEVGLHAPRPVPVMPADHQVAQKLHAASEPGSERVRDLSTSNSSTGARTSTWLRCVPRASGSSSTGDSTPGRR